MFRTLHRSPEESRSGRGGGLGDWAVKTKAGSELETLHRSFLLLENKLALVLIHLWSQAGVLHLHAEVALDQVEGLLVDLLVLVALQELDLIQACVSEHRWFSLYKPSSTMNSFSVFEGTPPVATVRLCLQPYHKPPR